MAKAPVQKTLTLTVPVRVLGIDANFDSATQPMCAYRNKHVYKYFTDKGFTVDPCQGPLAVRSQVASVAMQAGGVYVTGSGHGNFSTFQGYMHDAVFQVGAYPYAEVTGKIVHLFACFAGQDLGRDFVLNGCVAFFGYSEDFLWPTAFPNYFFECDSEIDRAFADGLTAAQVYDRVAALVEQRVADLYDKGEYTWADFLKSDFERLRCPSFPTPSPNGYGDPAAKLP